MNSGLAGLALRVMALVVDPTDPNTVYIGTFDGVYKTTTGGASWSPANAGLTGLVFALAIDPTAPATVYAATRDGASKSTDGAANWSPINAGTPNIEHNILLSVAVDPITPTTVYMGATGGASAVPVSLVEGVVKSSTGGGNWVAVNSGLTAVNRFGNISVPGLAIDPTAPTRLYAATENGGVFQSFDGGATWGPLNTGLPTLFVLSVTIDPVTPAIVYAATDGGGVFAMQQVPPSFDADARADVAIFRPPTGQWFIARSTDGGLTAAAFGAPGDVPGSRGTGRRGRPARPGRLPAGDGGMARPGHERPAPSPPRGPWAGPASGRCRPTTTATAGADPAVFGPGPRRVGRLQRSAAGAPCPVPSWERRAASRCPQTTTATARPTWPCSSRATEAGDRRLGQRGG